jgi:tetratricopeptide (TPR) repeat protein
VAKCDLGACAEALEDLTRAIQLAPRDATAFMTRGWAKGMLGDYQGEIEDNTRAIQLNPKLAEAYANRSLSKYQRGDFLGAIDDATVALSLQPQMGLGYYYRGLAYIALQRPEEGGTDLKRAQILLPDSADEIAKVLQN